MEKCHGCQEIEKLLRATGRNATKFRLKLRMKRAFSSWIKLHTDFAELERCSETCLPCRNIRHCLLQGIPVSEDAVAMAVRTEEILVRVRYRGSIIQIRNWDREEHLCYELGYKSMEKFNLPGYNLPVHLPADPRDASIYETVATWLTQCIQEHECSKYRSSHDNPTRLLRILSESEVVLVNCPQDSGAQSISYSALSYCWGQQASSQSESSTSGSALLTEAETSTVFRGRTTLSNIKDRYKPFSISDLAPTIQDAINITKRISTSLPSHSIEYIWIDAVCIVQDDPPEIANEVHRMHQVYGNAFFTLCAGSTRKATQKLLKPRLAWSLPLPYMNEGDEFWRPSDMSLESLGGVPAKDRAWMMQEEYLSPRILYWTAQRVYWRCFDSTCSEGMNPEPTRIEVSAVPSDLANVPRDVQGSFVARCRLGKLDHLHSFWCWIVEAYSRRSLSNLSDRLPALAGLAVEYCTATHPNTYLAGIWVQTIEKDLVWGKLHSGRDAIAPQADAPTWSWVSQCGGSPIHFGGIFDTKATSFEFLGTESGNSEAEEISAIDQVVQKGSQVKKLKLKGRFSKAREARKEGWFRTYFDDLVEEERAESGSLPIYVFEVTKTNGILLAAAENGCEYRRVGQIYSEKLERAFKNAAVVELTLI